MACADRLDTLLRLADGELLTDARCGIERHVASCEDCQATLDLLLTENRAIAAALAPAKVTRPLPLHGRLTAAAAALLLTGGVLYGLLLVYEGIDASRDRSAARAEALLDTPVQVRAEALLDTPVQVRAEALLDTPVQVRAEELPLEEFLSEVSESSGVPVELAPAARSRLNPKPRVSITLCHPITLRSLLALVAEFHDLTVLIEGDGVVLQ